LKIGVILLAGAALAACVPAQSPPPRRTATAPSVAPPVVPRAPQREPEFSPRGLENVMGHDARAVIGLFGSPDLDVREGDARKLQFLGPSCVLDVYFYPPRSGGEPVATYIDARLPDGRDTDRASCIAALSRR